MTNHDFYVIIGLGQTGLSYVRYCLKRGIAFAIIDSRPNPPGAKILKTLSTDIACSFGRFSRKLINKATVLLVSPGVMLPPWVSKHAKKHQILVTNDIALFIRQTTAPVIAITGSNGKSTVATLMTDMANRCGKNVKLAGNIGKPVLELLDENQAQLYILELSSFQLENISSLRAHTAALLNICEDHMDRYSNIEQYIAAKKRIYHHCQFAVANRHDKRLYPDKHSKNQTLLSFGLDQPKPHEFGVISNTNGEFIALGSTPLMAVKDIALQGCHNILNALSAIAMGYALQLDLEIMLQTLRDFRGLPHRCQFVRKLAGVSWYNDSKATNVGATVAAIESLSALASKKIILIAGGIGKGADFSPLRPVIKKHLRRLILIGKAAKQIERILGDIIVTEHASDLKAAVEAADLAAVRGDLVLLSPACASFDLFDNFEHRGNEFIAIVRAL